MSVSYRDVWGDPARAFTAGSTVMGAYRRTVDQQHRRRAALGRQRVENLRPHPLRRPTHKTFAERLVRAIQIARHVPPAAAALQHMHDPGDQPAVVNPRNAPRVPRQIRRNPRELGLRKSEKAIPHRQTPFQELESQKRPAVNPIYGS